MKTRCSLVLSLLSVFLGCSQEEKVEKVPGKGYLCIINLQGQREVIEAAKLFDPQTQKPQAQKVLSIDRSTGKTEFVPVENVMGTNPSSSRYQPVTRQNPNFPEMQPE